MGEEQSKHVTVLAWVPALPAALSSSGAAGARSVLVHLINLHGFFSSMDVALPMVMDFGG